MRRVGEGRGGPPSLVVAFSCVVLTVDQLDITNQYPTFLCVSSLQDKRATQGGDGKVVVDVGELRWSATRRSGRVNGGRGVAVNGLNWYVIFTRTTHQNRQWF
jgi:hypothetical protein